MVTIIPVDEGLQAMALSYAGSGETGGRGVDDNG